MSIKEFTDLIEKRLVALDEGQANELMAGLLSVLEPGVHASDCAHSCAPAYAPGPCDCGAYQ